MRKIILIIVVIFLCFFAAEFLLRILTPFYEPSLRALVKEEAYQGAQSALRVARGGQIILRKGDFKKDIDIIAVGDSMVFGSMAKESEVWTSLLAQKTGATVLNLGTGSQGPCAYNYMLRVAQVRLSAAPSVVLYTVFANDIAEGPCQADSYYEELFIWEDSYRRNFKLRVRKIWEWVFQHSSLYQIAKRLLTCRQLVVGKNFKPIYFRKDKIEFAFTPASYWDCLDLNDELIAKEFEQNLEKIQTARELTRNWKARFIVVLMPFKEQIYVPHLVENGLLPPDTYNEYYDLSYDRFVLRMNQMGIETVDLRPSFREAAKRGAKLYWTLDGHLTPQGNLLTAVELTKVLRSEGL